LFGIVTKTDKVSMLFIYVIGVIKYHLRFTQVYIYIYQKVSRQVPVFLPCTTRIGWTTCHRPSSARILAAVFAACLVLKNSDFQDSDFQDMDVPDEPSWLKAKLVASRDALVAKK
jgi:hypothetical protein